MLQWIDESIAAIGEVEFRTLGESRWGEEGVRDVLHLGFAESTPERFVLLKTKELIGRYETLVAEHAPRHILELGIYKGGSVALLAALARPAKLAAIEFEPEPVAALEQYLSAHHASSSITTHYGVDQGDSARVREIVAEDFSDEPLDMVVDDASHRLGLTRVSFETLFPRLRPGGVFVIEDWAWGVFPMESAAMQDLMLSAGPPLAHLVFELLLACASSPGLIDNVVVHSDMVVVTRGPQEIDPDAFAIDSYYHSEWKHPGRQVVPAEDAGSTA